MVIDKLQSLTPKFSFLKSPAPALAANTDAPVDTSTVKVNHVEAPPQKEASIAKGAVVGAIGAGLIAAASIGIPVIAVASFALPHIAPVAPSLLNVALRFCGLSALGIAYHDIGTGNHHSLVRGALLTAGGVASMAAAVGTFGQIGGLTSIFLGIGGFCATLDGIDKFGD